MVIREKIEATSSYYCITVLNKYTRMGVRKFILEK